MPVKVLYCEGSPQGLDIRVIAELAPQGCLVKAIGGKTTTFMDSILADRTIVPCLSGLVDRDFDCDFKPITQKPLTLFHQNVTIGWSWERKELENYLIDPKIVALTWGNKRFSANEYQQALEQASESIRLYTAARTALSCYKFKNYWGEEIKDFKARYQFPKNPRDLSKQNCEDAIRKIVQDANVDRIVTIDRVIEKFETLLPEFRPNGQRLNHPLTFFAGKDLLCALKPALLTWDLDPKQPIQAFLERIVHQLEKIESPWKHLPEWQAFHEILLHAQFENDLGQSR